MLRATLTLSAVYLAIVGLALMLVLLRFGVGAVPPDAPGELIALLRLLGGPAMLNWLSRDLDRSRTLDVILIANIVGFGSVARRTTSGE
jgi:hypothetical protein